MGFQNWMGNVEGSFYLTQLSIPGTHDTLTFNATPAAQDQDNDFNVAAQLNAGIRWFDLRLVGRNIGGKDVLIGQHYLDIPNTEFGQYVLGPTIEFLTNNLTECVIYSLTRGGDAPSTPWDTLLLNYMNAYGQGWFYTANVVPTLDQVRGKIVMALASYGGNGVVTPWGLDISGWPSNTVGTSTNTLRLGGSPVTFHVEDIYDDQYKGDQASEQITGIHQNIQDAAANTDPHNLYLTGTTRADGFWSSRQFALGPLLPPYPPHGYNGVALGEINQVPVTGGLNQQTVGILTSDFPNDTPGYIQTIIARNPLRRTGGHFFTIRLDERDNAIARGFISEGKACYVFPTWAPQRQGTQLLHRLRNTATGERFYTISDAERDNAIARFGFVSEGEACYVFPTQAQGTQPLHRLFRAAAGEHFYTTSDAERDNAIAHLGFVSEGEACYVYTADPSGVTPFYRLRSTATGEHFYTTSLDERDNAIARLGFTNEAIACWVLPAPAAGAVPLHRLRSTATGKHFYTTSDAERDNAIARFGFVSEGEACYVFPTQAQETQPLHRLRSTVTPEHFYTISDAERDNAIARFGFISEGEACYVYINAPSYVTPFYRLRG
jgi:ribosomal protein L33